MLLLKMPLVRVDAPTILAAITRRPLGFVIASLANLRSKRPFSVRKSLRSPEDKSFVAQGMNGYVAERLQPKFNGGLFEYS